jgi:cell division protein FtsQ
MRILPNQLRVAVRERTPVAFVRVVDRNRDQIKLIDGAGVILDMSPAMMAARHFSFPVVSGIKQADPLATRGARMRIYQKFVAALDASGEHLSRNLSEVNLSDPEDVRVTLPAKSSDLLLHFGDTNFLARYRIYQSHLNEWEQQYPQLASVDLRYESEVVLKMASGAAADNKNSPEMPSPPPPTASRAAAPTAAPAAKRPAVAKHAHLRKKPARKRR